MVEKTFDVVRGRFANLHDDEQGMEAAQVIMILVLVVIGLFPMFTFLKNQLDEQGSSAANQIGSAAN